jgi:hypothetical protein
MTSIRSLLGRVQKLERSTATLLSPFEIAYGSLEAFEGSMQQGIVSGTLDGRDMEVVIGCVRRWHRENMWAISVT